MNDTNETPQANQPLIQEKQVEDTTWPAGTEDQLPPELAQAQTIQNEAVKLEQAESEQKVIDERPNPIFAETKRPKTPQESFAELKKAKLQADRDRDEALRRLQELEARKSQQEDEDLSFSIAPDELAEGKHLSKVQKKISKLEQQVKEYEKRTQDLALESKLKAQYPDFDAVVHSENIELLKEQDPESAMIVDAIPNLYTKALAAYKAIKAMNINNAKANLYEAEKEKAQRNSAKPRPAVSVNPQTADSPLSRVNAFADGLTPELQKQLLKEMHEARSNR